MANLAQEIHFEFGGLSENNKNVSGSQIVNPDSDNGNFEVKLGARLPPGWYFFSGSAKQRDGKTYFIKPRIIFLDDSAPQILGDIDGVPQRPYQQEMSRYYEFEVGEGAAHRVFRVPVAEPKPIDFTAKRVFISRWIDRVNDESTAPSYTFKVRDFSSVSVKYSIAEECKAHDQVFNTVSGPNGLFEIKFIQDKADVDLSQESRTNGSNEKYCLSIWVFDKAKNVSSHHVEFYWKVLHPWEKVNR